MRILRTLLPGLGVLLLGYLIGELGFKTIVDHLAQIKWAFLPVLGLAFSWHVTNTIAWYFAFLPDAFRPRLRTLFMAKLAGESVNQLTPLANLGGEPLKAYLLKNQSPTSRGLASVVINKTAQVMTGFLLTVVAVGLIAFYWDLPRALPLSVRISLPALILGAALLIWLLYRRQQRLFSSLLAGLRRLGFNPNSLEARMAKAVRIDANISLFYREHKLRFFLVLFFHTLGWMLGVCETFVILDALEAGVGFDIAFLITSLAVVINGLFFFMPSNIGVMETGHVFLLMTLGLPATIGLSLGIAKRMRKIVWICIGWLFLTYLSRAVSIAVPQREVHSTSQSPDSFEPEYRVG